jgi:hypothetical protein
MSLLERLSKIFSSPGIEDYSYWVEVKCGRCGEIIRARVDMRNDLSIRYDDGKKTYYCRKVLLGEGDKYCFQSVEVELTFDKNRNLIDRKITGGEFVEE